MKEIKNKIYFIYKKDRKKEKLLVWKHATSNNQEPI